MPGSTMPPPSQLGRYAVVRRLGAGGMAEVFLAKSVGAEGLEKILVVKRVLPSFSRSAKFRSMFVDEAKVAMRLNHPNIVQVYAFEQVRDEFLLAMEFVDGLDLGRLVSSAKKRGRRLPFALSAYILAEASKGLDYAHNRKDERGEPLEIVHRDVSPQNLLLGYEGSVKVADFGIARASLISEETGVIKGKFAYMSPEQARGERVDRRSDVYSLGIVLAELLMGRAMFPGQAGLDVLEQVRLGKLTLPSAVAPDVPVELEAIVRKATAFEREQRYATARAFAADLTRFLHQQDEFFDAGTLERHIAEIAPREATSPDAKKEAPLGEPASAATINADVQDRELRERRHVVVLSGKLRERASQETHVGGIDAEAVRILGNIAFKAEAVIDWGHTNLDIARHRFKLVLGIGRPSVYDPLRATRLAMDIIEALEGMSADRSAPLTASIGLSRGVVSTVRDPSGRLLRYEPVGSVLEVAEKLADAGGPSEILAAGEVYRLVRREFAFDERNAREIIAQTAGGTSPRGLRAYPLRGARTREDRAQDALGSESLSLVARSMELRSIVEAYNDAITSSKSVFLSIVGDLGVGKSALVAAALETVLPEPRVLFTECAFGMTDVPFAPITELVHEACRIPDDANPELARERLEDTASDLIARSEDLAAVLAGIGPLVAPDGDIEAEIDVSERSRTTTRAMGILLTALARRGPVLMVIDALQWADAPTLELVSALVRQSFDAPVVGVFITRAEPRIEQILAGVPRIDLGELDDEGRRKLIRSRFQDASVPLDVEQAIIDRAGGNPFFIIELVDSLLERGVVSFEGDGHDRRVVRRQGVAIALPTTLEGAVAARFGELPEEERMVLRWLAAAGPGMHTHDLSSLMGVDVARALQSASTRGLVVERLGGTWGFQSAVVRQLAYESTDGTDRVRMHRKIGAYLSGLGAQIPPARIARHLERAGNHAAAADAYLAAASAARGVYSNRDALRFYTRALALLPPDSPQRFFAHEAREQILRNMSRRRDQLFELETMRAIAEKSRIPSLLAMAYNRLARYELDGGRTTGVEVLLRKALESAIDAGDRSAEIEALRLSVFLHRELGSMDKALDFCDRALARAGTDADQLEARANVLVQRGVLMWRMGHADEALEADSEAFVIFRRLGRKGQEAHALNSIGVTLASMGWYEDAITMIRSSLALDREMGDRIHVGMKLSNIGQLYADLGATDRAQSFLRRAVDVFEALDDPSGRSDTLSALAEVLLEQLGDADAAATALDDARILAERRDDFLDLAHERLVRVALEWHFGRIEEAESCARETVTFARSAGLVGFELHGLARQAEALAELGRLSEARDAARKARDGVKSRGSIERAERIYARVARTFQLTGDTDEERAAMADAAIELAQKLEMIRDPALEASFKHAQRAFGVHQLPSAC